LPDDHEDLEAWLDGHRRRVDARGDQIERHPVIGEFRELIDSDPVVRMYSNQMIAQVPTPSRTASGMWRASSSYCSRSTRC
jgi:phosphatidylserine decarboxylase